MIINLRVCRLNACNHCKYCHFLSCFCDDMVKHTSQLSKTFQVMLLNDLCMFDTRSPCRDIHGLLFNQFLEYVESKAVGFVANAMDVLQSP